MPEARRQDHQFECSVADTHENHAPKTDAYADGCVHVVDIFQNLSDLYTSLIECLQDDTDGPTSSHMVLHVLNQQKKLLVRMEHAIDTAITAGISNEEIALLVGRVDDLHQHSQRLMHKQAQDMERTISALQQQESGRIAYEKQRRRACG